MIIDRTEHLRTYADILPGLEAGLAAIEALPELKDGRYEFDGGFFLVQSGQTNHFDGGEFEAHRDYLDVQMLVGGAEEVAWEDISALTVSKPYVKDVELFTGPVERFCRIDAGMFYAAFPQDAHMACRHSGTDPHTYKKIVLKLPLKQ